MEVWTALPFVPVKRPSRPANPMDAVGEVVGFSLEVRRVARWVEFVKLPARTISAQPQSFVDEGRVDFEPAFRSMDAIAAFHVGTVSRVATGYDAGRELHCPGNILLHFIEAAILIDDRGIGRDVFRLLAGQVAAGVEGVNTLSLVKTSCIRRMNDLETA